MEIKSCFGCGVAAAKNFGNKSLILHKLVFLSYRLSAILFCLRSIRKLLVVSKISKQESNLYFWNISNLLTDSKIARDFIGRYFQTNIAKQVAWKEINYEKV